MKTQALLAALILATASAAQAQGTSVPMKPMTGASAAAMQLVDGEVRKLDLEKGIVVLPHVRRIPRTR